MTKIQVNSQGKAYLTTAGKALAGVQPTLVIKSITENGTYNASSDNADGYSSVTVNVSGGGGSTKYGASLDTFLGNVDANGALQPATEQSDLVFSGVEDVTDNALHYRFSRTKIKSVSFPDLTTVSGTDSCYYMCYNCTSLTSIYLPNLTTVSGIDGCYFMFYGCTSLTSVSLPELTTVSGNNGMRSMLQNCTNITSVSLPKLKTISGNYGMTYFIGASKITTLSFPELEEESGNSSLSYLCYSCSLLETVYFPKLSSVSGQFVFSGAFGATNKLADVYFNALTTTSFGSYVNQFNGMFNSNSGSTSGAITMHFPSNLSSTIQGLTGYPNFGATAGRLTVAFDLPATS